MTLRLPTEDELALVEFADDDGTTPSPETKPGKSKKRKKHKKKKAHD